MSRVTDVFRWFADRCRAVARRCRSVLGRSPYGHLPRKRMRVLDPDGKPVGDSRDSIAYVSRHGLLGPGITCPVCGRLAAQRGEWGKVTQTSWGEAVMCSCLRMLLASPDDDIDPVTPDNRYDPEVYHRFARPPKWQRPEPDTLKRAPVVGDRVFVAEGTLRDAEGNILAIEGDTATVSIPVGWSSGERVEQLPLATLKVLALPTLRCGDPVRIVRGPRAPAEGSIIAVDMSKQHSRLYVRVGDQTHWVEIGHVDKIHEPSPT